MLDDTIPELCGKPGDPVHAAGRENMTAQQLNGWLDTPGGLMATAQHGSRQAAANAMAQNDQADQKLRRSIAAARFENHPSVYPSVDDAMRGVGSPIGGFAASLNGTTDQIVDAVRKVDPSRGVRNLGEAPQDGSPVTAMMQDQHGRLTPADTRPPWRRD